MNDMKCPKCGGRLVYWGATGALLKCSQCSFGWGNEELWQELIRTRKALEIALNSMNSAGTHNSINCINRGEDPSKDDVSLTLTHALNEIIPALKKKDK